MEKLYYSAKSQLVHFKLDFCCWFAPVRIGLMITGYFNIVADVICLLGIANDGFSPTITRVQETLIEDFVNKPIPVMAYATELGFNVVLLCAIHRKDLVLMRVFMYYMMLAVVMSFLVYSIVINAVPVQIQLAIVFSTLFQMYIIILVRSVMVEMRMEEKGYELPTLVMSSLLKDKIIPSSDLKNGKTHEVIITEVPKKQEVHLTIVGKTQDKIKEEPKVTEIKKVAEVKKDDKETKKSVEVTIEAESKKTKDEKKKEEKRIKEEKKKEEKKIKEDKKKEEKNMKEEKKKAEKKSKEDKKDKEVKDVESKEEKKDKEVKDVEKAPNPSSTKDVKEAWLQTVTEHPKE